MRKRIYPLWILILLATACSPQATPTVVSGVADTPAATATSAATATEVATDTPVPTPTAPAQTNELCPQWVHDQYVTTGPDGKTYPTWHPAVDAATGCYFDHDHGDDPRASLANS